MKVIDLADHDSCATLASSIFAVNSRIWLYRFLYSNSVKIFMRFFFVYIISIAYTRCFTTF
jgi:hypothetical protein